MSDGLTEIYEIEGESDELPEPETFVPDRDPRFTTGKVDAETVAKCSICGAKTFLKNGKCPMCDEGLMI